MRMNLLRLHQQVDHNKKQTTLLDYNKYKNSEDRLDQMFSYYSFERKMIKWWKKLFLRFYDLVVVSVHILHTKTNKKDFTGNFLQKKSCQRIADWCQCRNASTSSDHSPASRLVRRDLYMYVCIQGVPGGMCQTSGGCSLC